MSEEYDPPIWPIKEGQLEEIQKRIENFAAEYCLREGFEYKPNNLSLEDPILIQEFYRLFLSPTEILWEGPFDPDEIFFEEESALIKSLRKVIPEFASKQKE